MRSFLLLVVILTSVPVLAYTLENDPNTVRIIEIPEATRKCTKDADCIPIDTTCLGCCQNDAVNLKFADEVDALVIKECKAPERGYCDYRCVPARPQCKKNRCVAQGRGKKTY